MQPWHVLIGLARRAEASCHLDRGSYVIALNASGEQMALSQASLIPSVNEIRLPLIRNFSLFLGLLGAILV